MGTINLQLSRALGLFSGSACFSILHSWWSRKYDLSTDPVLSKILLEILGKKGNLNYGLLKSQDNIINADAIERKFLRNL